LIPHNQTVVGEASTLSNLPRSSLFLTTKTFYNSSQKTVEEILPGLIESVKKIGKNKEGEKEYVDLFLIHAPTCGPEGRQLLWDAFQEVSFIFTLCSLRKGWRLIVLSYLVLWEWLFVGLT
jgi:diketogulonate reductase-like aldo/keto reductase